jgi:8-oxo-dGTP diphosphatase
MLTTIDKLAWIHIVDKKILCARSRGKDTFYIPGGKREAGETDTQALVREIKEELDVDLVPETGKYIGTFEAQAHGKPEGVMVKMTCYFSDYTGNILPSSEIEQVAWLQHQDKDKVSPVDMIIFDWLKERDLIT